MPKPRFAILSVTKSEVVARSAPVAADNFNTGIKAVVLSSTLHPASAIYSSAFALSCAVFTVVRPASRAALSIASYSAVPRSTPAVAAALFNAD